MIRSSTDSETTNIIENNFTHTYLEDMIKKMQLLKQQGVIVMK